MIPSHKWLIGHDLKSESLYYTTVNMQDLFYTSIGHTQNY